MLALGRIFSLLVVLALATTPAAAADWLLYDDFESGGLSPVLWRETIDNGSVEVIDGRLRVVHPPGLANSLNGLTFALWPEYIKGIKATMTMDSATGDLRGRIHGWLGMVGDHPVKEALQLRPNPNRNYIHAWMGEFEDHEVWLIDLFWAYFKSPLNLMGQPYTVTIYFDDEFIRWSVEGLGTIQFHEENEINITPLEGEEYKTDKFIGAKGYSAEAEGVVYVDDVYVQFER